MEVCTRELVVLSCCPVRSGFSSTCYDAAGNVESLLPYLQVKAACNKPGLVPKLEIIVTELEKCKKSLSEYLRYVDDAIG